MNVEWWPTSCRGQEYPPEDKAVCALEHVCLVAHPAVSVSSGSPAPCTRVAAGCEPP